VRTAAIVILCAALTACGSVTTPKVEPAAAKTSLTPICAFYSTVIAVGLAATKPDKAKLTVPRLRKHWPELVAAARRGREVQWGPGLESRMRQAYLRFLADIDETDAAVTAGDLPRFMRALRSAGRSLRLVDSISRESTLACTMTDGHGWSMSIGSSS
jgi:hypothetical protein